MRVLGFLALVVVATLAAGRDSALAVESLPRVEVTSASTLQVNAPVNGATVAAQAIVIEGSAPRGDEVRRSKNGPDQRIAVDADGKWKYDVELKRGENKFTFYLRSSSRTRVTVAVTYDPDFIQTPSSGESDFSPPVAPTPSAGQPETTGKLLVYFIDVRLGDAIYVRVPTGEDMVIDGGDSADELSEFLDSIGEVAVDVVVASHPHSDHVRGLVRVIKERQVGAVWIDGEPVVTNLAVELIQAIAGSTASKHVGRAGDTFALGQTTVRVLSPQVIGSDSNENSIVLRLDCGSSSVLFAGDAEFGSERKMIDSAAELDVDVLKLGHHGSRSSTSAAFLQATTPRFAVYQARVGNRFGHPHGEALDRLSAAGVQVFGTGSAGGTLLMTTACDDVFDFSPD
jgi:beta-lactamase superfamily II metal-dependent hydrolase